MTYDINNPPNALQGPIAHILRHKSGLMVEMMHEKEAFKATLPIIQSMKVDLIVELGTSEGGFTMLMADAAPGAEIHTFDRCPIFEYNRKFFPTNIHLHRGDVLKPHPDVIKLLKRPVRKFLYCDNGNKKLEVKLYSKYLSKNDYIGVHDWGREIFWKDVQPFIGPWEKVQWDVLEKYGVLTRIWRKE